MHIDRRKNTLRKKYQDAKIYCLPSKTRFPPGPIVVAISAAPSQQSSRDLVGESVAFVVAKFWCKNDELDGWIWCYPSLQNSDANDELAWREGMARSCLFFLPRPRASLCLFLSFLRLLFLLASPRACVFPPLYRPGDGMLYIGTGHLASHVLALKTRSRLTNPISLSVIDWHHPWDQMYIIRTYWRRKTLDTSIQHASLPPFLMQVSV
jgi:hypothetical protein